VEEKGAFTTAWSIPLAVALVFAIGSHELLAQEPVVEAEPIVVTLSALPFPLSAAPGSVTVIDRAAIEASRAVTLADVLAGAPFVDLSRVGSRGGLTTVTLRGGDPNFTLVLLDGIPLNDPTNLLGGSFDFSTLSADNIERVEIVRGPLSSRFGSEAMAGVIHIVSRRGHGKPTWGAEAALGSFAAREARLATEGRERGLDYSAGASWFEVGEQVEDDPYRLATIAATAGLSGSEGELRLTTRFHDYDAEVFPESGGGPLFSTLRETKRSEGLEFAIGFEGWRRVRPWWTLSATGNAYRRRGSNRTPPILDDNPPGSLALPRVTQETALDRDRMGVTSAWHHDSITLFAGADVRRERGESDAVIADAFPADFTLERTTWAASGELAYRGRQLVVDLAVRLDDPEGFERVISPRGAVAFFPPGPGTRVAASWGQGFKLPSFFALGEPNVGNPDLVPEKSRGFDLSVSQQFPSDASISITYFRQRYRNLIDFSPQEFRLVNRRLARSRGVEMEMRWRAVSRLLVSGHVRWVEATLEGTDEPLRDRPRWRGGVSLTWADPRTTARLETVWVGERFDFQIPVPERRTVDGYTSTSLAALRRLPGGFAVFVRIDNLFDAEYQEFVGFPAPGRSARVGLNFDR
jgi:vitamin B12 transporter